MSTTQDQKQQDRSNKKQEAFTTDQNLDGGRAPYSKQDEASGGFTTEVTDKSSRATGGQSIMSQKIPGTEDSYTITALKGRGSNTDLGYADSNLFVDAPGEAPWYSPDGTMVEGENGTFNVPLESDTRKPTTENIIDWAKNNEGSEKGTKNKRPYGYKDFVFCKY